MKKFFLKVFVVLVFFCFSLGIVGEVLAMTAPCMAAVYVPVIIGAVHRQQESELQSVSLKGSFGVAKKQNNMADKKGWSRVKNRAQLERLEDQDLLVFLPNRKGLVVNPSLDLERRFVRPETKQYLLKLGSDFYAKFHKNLRVNSAVRTVEEQKRLARTNGNAGPTTGPTASSHLAGGTVDLAKRGLSKAELNWLRKRLEADKKANRIVAVEERRQPVFHVMAYNTVKTKPQPKEQRLAKAKRPG